MTNSAVLSEGVVEGAGAHLSREIGRPGQVVVLVRGKPGYRNGKAYRVCRPEDPIDFLALRLEGYVNYYVVSLVDVQDQRLIEFPSHDGHQPFDVEISLSGHVADPEQYLKENDLKAGALDKIMTILTGKITTFVASVRSAPIGTIQAKLQEEQNKCSDGRVIEAGVRISFCSFKIKPATAWTERQLAMQLSNEYRTPEGRAMMEARIITSSSAREREMLRNFIDKMTSIEKADFEEHSERERRKIDEQYRIHRLSSQATKEAAASVLDVLGRLSDEKLSIHEALTLVGWTSTGSLYSDLMQQNQPRVAEPEERLSSTENSQLRKPPLAASKPDKPSD